MGGRPSATRAFALSALIAVAAVSLACCPLFDMQTGLLGGSACAVPNLLGEREAPARLSLSELGLTAVVVNEHSDGFDAGIVIRTDPPAGTELQPCEGQVVLVVSLGPAEEPPPEPTDAPPATAPPPTATPVTDAEPLSTAEPIDGPDLGPMGVRVYDEGFDHGYVEAFRPEWNVDAEADAAYASESGNLVTEKYLVAWAGDETWYDYGITFGRADFTDVTQFQAMVRVQDEQNYIGIFCWKGEGGLLCEGERVVDGQGMGVPNFLQQTTRMFVDGQVEGSTIELRAVGNEFSVLRDGEVVGRMTDDTFASGGVGFLVEGRLLTDYVHVYEPAKPASFPWTYLRDDFSRNQWLTGDGEGEVAWVSRELLPDAYRMQVRALIDGPVVAYETVPIQVPFDPDGFPYAYTASVRVRKVSGPSSTGMGLLFGCLHENACYEFSIIPDEGTALLSRIDEDGWVELQGPLQIGSLPRENVLQVATEDGSFTFLVNGVSVMTAELEDAEGTLIGVSGQVSGLDNVGVVTFDDIVVSQAGELAD